MSPTASAAEISSLRPVVLGSAGRAGRVIAEQLSGLAPETVMATRAELDITDYFHLCWELERLEANLVVNAAAWTDVEGCEKEPGRAFQINAEGARHVARAAAGAGARVIHISTDYVFDGRKGAPYTESDAPAPLSVYGKSKLAGEELVRLEQPEALVVRTAWLFGGAGRRPGFLERILELAQEAAPIPVVRDQVGSPTSVAVLADGIVELVRARAQGTVHLVCEGGASRAEFAALALEIAGHGVAEIVPVPSSQVQTVAPRPADTRLDTTLFVSLTGTSPPPWQDALRDTLAPPVSGD